MASVLSFFFREVSMFKDMQTISIFVSISNANMGFSRNHIKTSQSPSSCICLGIMDFMVGTSNTDYREFRWVKDTGQESRGLGVYSLGFLLFPLLAQPCMLVFCHSCYDASLLLVASLHSSRPVGPDGIHCEKLQSLLASLESIQSFAESSSVIVILWAAIPPVVAGTWTEEDAKE